MNHSMRTTHSICFGLLAALVVGPATLAQGPSESKSEPVTPTPPPVPLTQKANDAKIDEILTALQNRADSVKDITCKVIVEEKDDLSLTSTMRYGRFKYMVDKPNPMFMLYFDVTRIGQIKGWKEWYLFDGRWLYDAREQHREVTKQEIARKGEKVNLFDIETSPFPLPFGQDKAKILANFDVRYEPPGYKEWPNMDHLVCVPKETSRMHGRFDKVDFFISQIVHLPFEIVVTKNKGLERTTVRFPGLSAESLNTGLTVLKDFSVPSEWKAYKVKTERLPDPPKPEAKPEKTSTDK